MMGIGRKLAHLYGLPEHGQTDISTWLGVRCESLIPDASAAASRRPKVDISGLEPDPKWTPSNSIKFSVQFSAPALFCWCRVLRPARFSHLWCRISRVTK